MAGRGCLPALLTGSVERGTVGVAYTYMVLLKMAILNHYPEGADC
jgi:hypothetical protein